MDSTLPACLRSAYLSVYLFGLVSVPLLTCWLEPACTLYAYTPGRYNWNVVWVKTCDGSSWTGNQPEPQLVDGVPLYYRGRAILDAVLDDLMDRGIKNATDVVVGGGSAGALGVYLNVDHYKERLTPPDGRGIRFSALPDGGFFMDMNTKGYHDGMAWLAAPNGMNAVLHPACAAAHEDAPELCMFAPHVAAFIQTPIFVLQAKYDAWQIPSILGSNDPAVITSFGDNMTKLLRSSVLNRPGNAAFVDACRHHCEGWDMYIVDGICQAKAFATWYAAGSSALPNGGALIDGSAYPCEHCTCSFG